MYSALAVVPLLLHTRILNLDSARDNLIWMLNHRDKLNSAVQMGCDMRIALYAMYTMRMLLIILYIALYLDHRVTYTTAALVTWNF